MAGPAYQWGEWRFEPTEARLTRNGEVVPLPAKTLDVLTALIRRAPRLVTKEEIFAAVWPDAAVEEGNIAFHVAALRKAIDSDGPSAIETVRGRGYRFVADVAIGHMAPTASIQQPLIEPDARPAITEPRPAPPRTPEPAPAAAAAAVPKRSWATALIGAAVLAIAMFAWWRTQQPPPHAIAIQPFEILDPRPGEENFPDGILTYLRNTMQRENIPIAPLESATAVLSGQLHPVPNGFRVTVQLTATGGGARLWEWSYNVSYDDERPVAGSGPDDERSRVQAILAYRAGQGLKSYLSLSGVEPVTR
ncbi:MAG TPA: transcriptional regulator [Vicinamibacterales bacterium]|nr:transcriptional regulator [Vicinamibacterales bacterium]